MNIGPLVSIKWKERSMSNCEKTEICHFVHIIIILIILFLWPAAFVLHFSSKKTTQPYLLSPSACPWPI